MTLVSELSAKHCDGCVFYKHTVSATTRECGYSLKPEQENYHTICTPDLVILEQLPNPYYFNILKELTDI